MTNQPSHTIAFDATELLALAEEAKTKLSLASTDQERDMTEESVYVSLWPDEDSEKVVLRNRKHGLAVFENTAKSYSNSDSDVSEEHII